MKKEKYEHTELEVVEFETEDDELPLTPNRHCYEVTFVNTSKSLKV